MSTIELARDSLGLAPLVIHGSRTAGPLWFRAGDLVAPDWAIRSFYAPDSSWVPGRQLLASVDDAAVLTVLVNVGPADSAFALKSHRAELEAAVRQFSYRVTLTVDGVSETWQADASAVSYGDLTMRAAPLYRDFATLQIPVNPGGA